MDGGDVDTDTDADSDADTDDAVDSGIDGGGQPADCPADVAWYDDSTGLCWQNPPSEETMGWQEAIDYCENLSLGEMQD